MAKKCMVYRDKKRNQMIKSAYKKRELIKDKIKNPDESFNEKVASMKKLNKRPKNESKARQKNRCQKCGRPRGYLRKFGMCRLCVRFSMMRGLIPGLKKASW
jgi:small subunit ribosomal protein S14